MDLKENSNWRVAMQTTKFVTHEVVKMCLNTWPITLQTIFPNYQKIPRNKLDEVIFNFYRLYIKKEKGILLMFLVNKTSLYLEIPLASCLPIARETGVQSHVDSYQRLKKWYLMPLCLTPSIIRYGSRLKWSNPGVASSHTSRCSNKWKGSLQSLFSHERFLTKHTKKFYGWIQKHLRIFVLDKNNIYWKFN